jgi:hypothetical protein
MCYTEYALTLALLLLFAVISELLVLGFRRPVSAERCLGLYPVLPLKKSSVGASSAILSLLAWHGGGGRYAKAKKAKQGCVSVSLDSCVSKTVYDIQSNAWSPPTKGSTFVSIQAPTSGIASCATSSKHFGGSASRSASLA